MSRIGTAWHEIVECAETGQKRLIKQLLISIIIIIAGALVALQIDRLSDEHYRGDFKVVDGDTLRLGNERMRLMGFDAPELKQRCGGEADSWACGEAAKQALQTLVARGDFRCEGGKSDKYGRRLVFCFVGDEDVGALMVRSGMAVATQKLLYQSQQLIARNEGVGLWSGPFERPSDWRKLHKRAEIGLPLLALLMVVRRSIGW
jgi:endonuclease YncB( thermonuclease family)